MSMPTMSDVATTFSCVLIRRLSKKPNWTAEEIEREIKSVHIKFCNSLYDIERDMTRSFYENLNKM